MSAVISISFWYKYIVSRYQHIEPFSISDSKISDWRTILTIQSQINNTFDMSAVTVVLQQDIAPAHTSNRVQNFALWLENKWPPFWSDANPLDYAL